MVTLKQARKEKGVSMKGGRYPIRNEQDAKNAEHAIGRTPAAGRPAVRKHIEEREKALGIKPGKAQAKSEGKAVVIRGHGMGRQRVGY